MAILDIPVIWIYESMQQLMELGLDCYKNKTVVLHDEITLDVIGIEDLRRNKKVSGRL